MQVLASLTNNPNPTRYAMGNQTTNRSLAVVLKAKIWYIMLIKSRQVYPKQSAFSVFESCFIQNVFNGPSIHKSSM